VRAAGALPRLEVLLAGGLPFALRDADVAALATAPAAASLRALDVSGSAALSDAALAALRACTRLRRLVLARQGKLTAEGLLSLALAVPSLAAVTAVRCRRLHARALAGVADAAAAARQGGARPRLSLERGGGDAPWWDGVG
jgi:hypothetical protein